MISIKPYNYANFSINFDNHIPAYNKHIRFFLDPIEKEYFKYL